MYYVGSQTSARLNPNNLAFFKSEDTADDRTPNLFVSDVKILIMKCFI